MIALPLTEPAAPEPADARPLAVFDADDVLLPGDTLRAFLTGYARRRGLRPGLAAVAARLLTFDPRARAQRLLADVCAGEPIDDVAEYAVEFAHRHGRERVRYEALGRLRAHQQAGDRVVLLSSGLDLYVAALADEFGVGEAVCTRTEVVGGTVTGRLAGPWLAGDAAAAALRDEFGDEPPAGSVGYVGRGGAAVAAWLAGTFDAARAA